MKFYDLHCHTSGISRCARITFDVFVDRAKAYDYDGFVLTNHYTASDLEKYGADAFIEKYIDEYIKTRDYGKKVGVNVLFGLEVTVAYNPYVHLLIYGATPDFLRANPDLPNLTQREIYEVCEKYGCVLVNAHPYRYGQTVQDLRYLDGVEVNCHFLYDGCYVNELANVAKENHIALTCGCDYHGDCDRPCAGVYLPDDVNTSEALAYYLKNSTNFSIKVNDPVTKDIFDFSVDVEKRKA